jgi:hypothetical protein
MESSGNRINIIVYAENEEAASNLIGSILSTRVSETDVWNEKISGRNIYGYIRSPGTTPTASPIGITDILIIQASENSVHWASIKTYIDARKGIPFKFLTSNDDLSEVAKTIDSEFIRLGEITTGASKQRIINSAINLEETLRNVFNKIDVDHNGSIDAGEILNVSKELGHPLTSEDANEISKSLSRNGKIGYDSFKQWWILRNADFNSFRKVVEIELVVNNFIKKSKETFNAYLDKLQKRGENLKSQETGLLSVVNISPEKDFQGSGTSLNGHISLGSDFDTIAASFPNYLKETPASFGLELRLKNANDGGKLIEVLEGLKEMAVQMEPNVKRFFDAGIMVNFRHVGTSVFIDVSYGGMAGDKINGVLSMFNPSSLNFAGTSDFHICSKFSPVDLLSYSYEKLIQAATHIKIEGKGEYTHLKTLFDFVINTITSINNGNLPSKMKPIVYLLKFASIIRKIDFNFKYDVCTVQDVIMDTINNLYSYEPSEGEPETLYEKNALMWKNELQPFITSNVEQFSGMAQMFLAQFLEGILALDLDNLALYATLPIIKFYFKFNVMIRGISDFIAKVLQQ